MPLVRIGRLASVIIIALAASGFPPLAAQVPTNQIWSAGQIVEGYLAIFAELYTASGFACHDPRWSREIIPHDFIEENSSLFESISPGVVPGNRLADLARSELFTISDGLSISFQTLGSSTIFVHAGNSIVNINYHWIADATGSVSRTELIGPLPTSSCTEQMENAFELYAPLFEDFGFDRALIQSNTARQILYNPSLDSNFFDSIIEITDHHTNNHDSNLEQIVVNWFFYFVNESAVYEMTPGMRGSIEFSCGNYQYGELRVGLSLELLRSQLNYRQCPFRASAENSRTVRRLQSSLETLENIFNYGARE